MFRRFFVEVAFENQARSASDARAKIASRRAGVNVSNMRFVPQNTVSEACWPKVRLAAARRQKRRKRYEKHLRNAARATLFEAPVSTTIFDQKSSKNRPKSVENGASGRSRGLFERPGRAKQAETRRLERPGPHEGSIERAGRASGWQLEPERSEAPKAPNAPSETLM